MPGILPPPTPPGKLGWDGQSPLVVPKGGLSMVPGAGLIGRTQSGKLFLDAANASVAEPVHFFVPGVVSARTVGKWRNRRAKGSGTLAVMEANALTAPTVSGDASNFWRVTVTDALGSVVQLPISTAGQTFYDLNQLGKNKVVDAGAYDASVWAGGSSGIGGALIHTFTPSQGLVVGGASAQIAVFNAISHAAISGAKIRCTILDATATVLAEATVYTTGAPDKTINNGGSEALVWNFDEVVALTGGQAYFIAFDMLQSWALADPTFNTRGGVIMQLGKAVNQAGTVPASSVQSIDGQAPGASVLPGTPAGNWLALSTDDGSTNAFWSDPTARAANTAKINALTVAQALSGTAPSGVCGPRANTSSGQFLCEFLSLQNIASAAWGVLGGTSGVAPSFGDLTIALAATGIPAAGTAPSDVNLRVVMLP